MIEFKAECGHTVRAKDEDTGKVVRCSYCGQDATVPDRLEDDDLDRLFTDEDLGKDPGPRRPVSAQVVKSKRRWWGKRPRRGPKKEFNPFALVIKLCYYTCLIIGVIVIVQVAVIPLIREYQNRQQTTRAQTQRQPRAPKPRQPSASPPSTPRQGLRGLSGDGGLYVSCVPASARIYCLPVQAGEKAPSDRIDDHARSCSVRSAGKVPRVSRGEYLVEFALPWSDPELNKYPGFEDFRRRLRRTNSTSERRKLMRDYFVPDEADEVFVCERPDQIYLVRHYRGVQVRDKQWTAVRALFLPRVALDGAKPKFFEVGPLIEHLPKKPQYGFKEDHVRDELKFFQVAAADQDGVLEALRRCGVIPCRTEDRNTYLFKIDVATGELGARDISD